MTAGATLELAAFGVFAWAANSDLVRATARLARKTEEQVTESRRAVEVAEREVDVSQRSFAASIQPILAEVPGQPPSVHQEHGFDVTLLLRNIGSGVAIITGLSVEVTVNDTRTAWVGSMSTSVVAPSEQTTLIFRVPNDRPELQPLIDAVASGALEVVARYTDITGQAFRSRAFLHDAGHDNHWTARQVALYRGDDTVSFAMSGPSGM